MENRLFSLSKIFTERLFRIPDYQRGYAWTEKQLREFWGDLVQLEIDKNHYIGVLTLEEVPEKEYKKWDDDLWIIQSKSYIPYHIVDGQQRLTTAIILMQCIIESIQPTEKLNYTSQEAIRSKFIFDSKDEGISRSYLFGYEKNNPSFEFLKTKVFLEKSDESVLHETIYTANLEFAKSFFKEKLNNLTFEEKEILFKKLSQHFLFNIYSISSDIDVHVTFETMNNRGKPLSHLELLKNRLIYLSTKFPCDESEKSKLRRAINECWKSVYHFLGKNKENPLIDDLFLKVHFFLYFHSKIDEIGEEYNSNFGRTTIERRIAEINNPLHQWHLLDREFVSKNIKEGELSLEKTYAFIKDLKESVIVWFNLLNPQESSYSENEKYWLEKLNRLGFSSIVFFGRLTLALYKMTEYTSESKVLILKLIENLIFVRDNISGYTSDKLNNVIKLLSIETFVSSESEKNIIKTYKTSKLKLDLNEIKQFFLRRPKGFYKWEGIKYFLFEYELFLKEKSKTSRDKIIWNTICQEVDDDYTTIEHIYPQTDTVEYWKIRFKKYTPSQKEKLKNSLGNLVALSRPKNSSLQNISFDDKKNRGVGYVGFRFGSYSENEVAEFSEWTAKEILKRGVRLLEFMEQRWELDMGKKMDKVELLGLDFVLKKENLRLKDL